VANEAYTSLLSEFLKRTVEQLHELSIVEPLGYVSDVKLPFGLVVICDCLIGVELFVVLEDLLSRHLRLHLLRGLV
jgi:hypothetical protein